MRTNTIKFPILPKTQAAVIQRVVTELNEVVSPGPEVIKPFSCSTQLSTKFVMLINVKLPTSVGILTFMSGKNSILGLPEPKKAEFLDIVILMYI